MEQVRKSFQGVLNILSFNRHFYLMALLGLLLLVVLARYSSDTYQVLCIGLVLFVLTTIIVSLTASFYIYDVSELYSLNWIPKDDKEETIVNIHAGFDETSHLLHQKFSNARLIVLDFYNPLLNTEVSIRRARKAYAPYPNTKQISSSETKIDDGVADKIFVMLSAHEIRDVKERIEFFRELSRKLNSKGEIYVTEHLRDCPNFLAFTIGFFHFYSRNSWLDTFRKSGLKVFREVKITPFITTFILRKNGDTF